MPYPSQLSALVVGVNRTRRREVSDRLRETGAVVVEVMTVPQAEAAMRQLRFEIIFVDFLGPGVGTPGFHEIVRAMDPEARVFVLGPPVDRHPFEALPSSGLTRLGVGSTPDSMDETLLPGLEEARGQEHLGMRRSVAAPSTSKRSNGRRN